MAGPVHTTGVTPVVPSATFQAPSLRKLPCGLELADLPRRVGQPEDARLCHNIVQEKPGLTRSTEQSTRAARVRQI